jgi:hypothetical protein
MAKEMMQKSMSKKNKSYRNSKEGSYQTGNSERIGRKWVDRS